MSIQEKPAYSCWLPAVKKIFLVLLLVTSTVLSCGSQMPGSFSEKETMAASVVQRSTPTYRQLMVMLDPGHGGRDPGTCYRSMKEKDMNLDIVLRLGSLLKNEGIATLYTRKTDKFVSLDDRVYMANRDWPHFFISVHNNYLPGNSWHRGTETLYCSPADTSGMNGKRLAQLLQQEVVAGVGTKNLGIFSRPDLAVLHRTKMPAAMVEVGYMSNCNDRGLLLTPKYRQKAADSIFRGIIRAAGEKGARKSDTGKWMIK